LQLQNNPRGEFRNPDFWFPKPALFL